MRESLDPDFIAAGNLGCMVQIGRYTELPVLHTVSLIDWATGGPLPAAPCGGVEPAMKPGNPENRKRLKATAGATAPSGDSGFLG